jgi:hypothetical protein
LKNAFKELYPTYVSDKLELGTTYVKQTTTVNGHALSGNVTVSKSDVGLGNVPNVSTNDQTPTYTEASTLTALSSGEKLSIAFGKLAKAVSSLISHINNTNNPHSVTKAQVQLGNVVNTGDSATPVENGTTKFTTGGAYTEFKTRDEIMQSLPTDAVLHYSFDEVPDYPDGNADVRLIDNNTYDIQSTSYKFYSDVGGTISNENGNAKIVGSGNNSGVRIDGTNLLNKIIKLKIKITEISGNFTIAYYNGILFTFDKIGTYEVAFMYTYTGSYNNLYLHTNNTVTATIEAIYIGDGSYSTPIIDNANGQNNATNNGGIAVKGVSGKGVYFLNEKTVSMGDYRLNNNFSLSVWVKPDNETTGLTGQILVKANHVIIRNGDENDALLKVYMYKSANEGYRIDVSSLLPANVWTNIVVVKNQNSCSVYLNGILVKTQTVYAEMSSTTNTMFLGYNNNTRPQSLDDFLIFDRALSDTEVMALYLNKANTPKYFLGNSELPAPSGNVPFTTGGAYNLLTSLAPTFSTTTPYAVGDMVTYSGRLYTCTIAHSAGAWNASHFTVANLNTEFQKPADNVVQRYDSSTTYVKGELVIYNNKLYKCTQTTYIAGDFDPTKFTNVSMYPSKNEIETCISRYVFNYSLNGISVQGNLPALSAGSECVLRLDNDSDRSATIGLKAQHAYSLGVTFISGGVSTIQKLTQGQDFSVTVSARGYLEVILNYLEVDGDSIANDTMFSYPIPTIRYS